MKKLLMRLFPRYFTVHNHTVVNFEDVVQDDSLRLVLVDDESINTFDKLGISDERGSFLMKEVRKAMIDTDCRVNVMHIMQQHVKHINEFYVTVLMMEKEASYGSNGGLNGLLKAIIEQGPPPTEDKD
jgi:hypothetical protein